MKQTCRGCKISQGAGCEGKGSDGKADDGEVLKMPAIGVIDGCRIVDEPDVGEGEGGEAEELGSFVSVTVSEVGVGCLHAWMRAEKP